MEKLLYEKLKDAHSVEEQQEVLSKFESIDLSKVTGDSLLRISQDVLDDYKSNMYEVASNFRLIENEFLARHEYK